MASLATDEGATEDATRPPVRSQEWRLKINRIQSSKVTPEIRRGLLQRAESKRITSARVRKSKALRSSAAQSAKSWSTCQRRMESVRSKFNPSLPVAFGGGRTLTRSPKEQEAYKAEMDKLMMEQTLDMTRCQEMSVTSVNDYMTSSDNVVGMALVVKEAEESDVDDDEIQADISEFQALLEKIKTEPTDEEEIAANFKLYEQYLETVEIVRQSVFELWSESRESFPQSAVVTIERELQRVDSQANMEINFDSGRWFVYEMTQKAETNRQLLLKLSKSIQTRLELLNAENDCPICLEPMGQGNEERPITVLGCCHSVCTECWEHWMAMKHGHAFCPLCRHEEFLEEILMPEEEGN